LTHTDVARGNVAERRPIIAHLRSASGPDMTRFALDFARHAGGDLLWIGYVPESVRGWFGRFAESVDPTCSMKTTFHLARLFGAPSNADLEVLLDHVEARRLIGAEDAGLGRIAQSPEVARVADAIDRGWIHIAGLLLDVHHVPTFARQLRVGAAILPMADRTWQIRPASIGTASLNLRSILRRCRAANLQVLVATVESTSAPARERSALRDDAAAVLAAVDEAADLTISVSRVSTGGGRPPRFDLSVCQSRDPELPAGTNLPAGNWDALLSAIRPQLPWTERLARAYPREESPSPGAVREAATSWSDPVQDEFARVAERRGWTVTRASGEQDRREHWDVSLEGGKERYRVDVKARSRIRRRDPAPQDDWHWVELRGIVDDGWLFGGQADLIAFQTSDSFVLVQRVVLAAHVRAHVDPDDAVTDPRRAEYRVYHRRDTGESPRAHATGSDRGLLTLIPTDRLRQLAHEEWPVTVDGEL
jgi:hypothetical protein